MVQVIREYRYSNGRIVVSSSLDSLGFVVYKEGQIVDTKLFPLSIWNNVMLVDGFVKDLKGKHTLLHLEDDFVKVVASDSKRYTIRGTTVGLHILYTIDTRTYMKSAFLPYNYNALSFSDYAYIFGTPA